VNGLGGCQPLRIKQPEQSLCLRAFSDFATSSGWLNVRLGNIMYRAHMYINIYRRLLCWSAASLAPGLLLLSVVCKQSERDDRVGGVISIMFLVLPRTNP
jgi:hypothetical protein